MTAEVRRGIIKQMDSAFVRHPAFRDASKSIDEMLNERDELNEVPNLMITGPSGAGKTTLCRKFEQRYPRVPNGIHRIDRNGASVVADSFPVLRVRMPPQPTAFALGREMLREIGDEMFLSGDLYTVMTKLRAQLPACCTKAVAIDDAQRAVDRDGFVKTEGLADFFKTLTEDYRISFVLFGLGRVTKMFATDPQFDRRWDKDTRIEPYSWGDVSKEATVGRLNFMGVAKAFEKMSPLPFAPEVNVEDERTCLRLYYAARGLTGYFKILMLDTMRVAHRDPCKTEIDFDLLYKGFEVRLKKDKVYEKLINPFGREWVDGTIPPPLPDDRELIRPIRLAPRKGSAFGKGTKKDRKLQLRSALSPS